MRWFYGFKLLLFVIDQCELLAIQLTPGNTDDRIPVPQMTLTLWAKLVGERGYLSQTLFVWLAPMTRPRNGINEVHPFDSDHLTLQ